jgi:hypothetical protein
MRGAREGENFQARSLRKTGSLFFWSGKHRAEEVRLQICVKSSFTFEVQLFNIFCLKRQALKFIKID